MDPSPAGGVWMRAEWERERESRRLWLVVLGVLVAIAAGIGWYLIR